MGRKRERVELIHDILKAVQEHGGTIKPTHLLYKANLSYDAFRRYVGGLMTNGLLAPLERNGRKVYILTEKGQAMLDQCKKLRRISESLEGQ